MKYLAHCKDYCLVLHIITEDNAKALQFVKFEASVASHGFKCYQGEKFVDNIQQAQSKYVLMDWTGRVQKYKSSQLY